MNTTNDTSLTKAAGPASVFVASTMDTSTGSVAFNGLEKGGLLTANPKYLGRDFEREFPWKAIRPRQEVLNTFLGNIIIGDDCWGWAGQKNAYGYSIFRMKPAHRLVFTLLGRELAPRIVLDHLCRNRGCVNPDHLEAVSQRENTLRGVGPSSVNAKLTHCRRGHEFTEENARFRRGRRDCRKCDNIRRANRRVKNG